MQATKMPNTKAASCECMVKTAPDGSPYKIVYCPLHAAAPELLEALKASAQFAHARGSYHTGTFDYCTTRQCTAAREAIRKAASK